MMRIKKAKNTLKNDMDIITCKHCQKKIIHPEIVGLTLVCPYCKKSVNGQYHHPKRIFSEKILLPSSQYMLADADD